MFLPQNTIMKWLVKGSRAHGDSSKKLTYTSLWKRNVHLKHFLWIVKAMERHTHALGLAHVQLAGTREQETTAKNEINNIMRTIACTKMSLFSWSEQTKCTNAMPVRAGNIIMLYSRTVQLKCSLDAGVRNWTGNMDSLWKNYTLALAGWCEWNKLYQQEKSFVEIP